MRTLILISLFLSSIVAFAQEVEVLDANNEPLPGAHVIISGGSLTREMIVLTSANGRAVFPPEVDPNQGPFQVRIKYLGYKEQISTLSFTGIQKFVLEVDAFNVGDFVVTAQYAPAKAAKAVHKIKVIDRRRIESQGAVTLEDVLQNEVNMRIGQDNVLGSSVSVQGVSGQNVKILIDGVPMVGRLNGNIDLSQINLNNIERIEIVEGPLSVNYGTDALAGTINLITKKGGKEKTAVGLNTYYESAGQYNLDGNLSRRIWKGNLSISGGRNYFDGWSPNDPFVEFPKRKLADTNRTQRWNSKEQLFGKLQYQMKLKETMLRPYGDYFYENILNRGYPRQPYGESAFDDRYHTWRINGGVDASGKLGNDFRYNVLAAYNQFMRIKNTFIKDLTTLELQESSNPSDHDTSRFDLWMSRGTISSMRDSAKLNYQLGYDISYETAFGKRIKDKSQAQGDYALFASAEWTPWNNLVVRPGVRYGYNTSYIAPVIPSLNLKWNRKDWTIRGAYARGFRAPSLKELYFEFVDVNHNILGSTDLKAEHSDNYQATITYAHTKEQSRFSAELGGYYNDIRNLITLAQEVNSTVFTYINVGKFKTHGLQGNVDMSWEHWKWTIGGALIGRYNQLVEVESVSTYSYSPEVRGNLTYDLHKQNMSVSVYYKFTGAVPGFASNSEGEVIQTLIGDYQMLDVTIAKKLFKNKLKVLFGGKNLFNVTDINATSAGGGAHSSGAGRTQVSFGTTIFCGIRFNADWK